MNLLVAFALLVAVATAQRHPDLNARPDGAPEATMVPAGSDAPAVAASSTQQDTTQAPADVTTAAADVSTTAAADVTTQMMDTTTTTPANYYPSVDDIIQAFKAIAQSEYFKGLSYDDQMLVLELTSGGEVGKIVEVMDNIGYERLFNFIYKIPLRYMDGLMQFILAGIQRENLMAASNNSS
ncbi:uncharacterized protein LOC143285232 [Babylonia areolata]|uniref:uncharacterized protein LOC143285232 n=1 Tax=Babylonia areolata TaxID=304850 RepID=UPI003FD2065A